MAAAGHQDFAGFRPRYSDFAGRSGFAGYPDFGYPDYFDYPGFGFAVAANASDLQYAW